LKLGKTPGFREIGSGDIPFKYYFGVIALIRVHHGSEDDNGFTACVDKTKSSHKSENDMLEIFGDQQKAKDAYQKMMNLYNEWVTAAPRANVELQPGREASKAARSNSSRSVIFSPSPA
jgi:hypothetical protein